VEALSPCLDPQILPRGHLLNVLGIVVIPVGDVAGVEDDVVAEPAHHLGHGFLISLGAEVERPTAMRPDSLRQTPVQ
jgi:hypothetical protein